MVKLTNLDGKWSEPIGRLMISFAHIEREIVDGLITVAKDPITNHTSKLGFKQRLDLLLDLLNSHSKDNKVIEDLITDLKKIEEISKIRNMVAHNPLVLEVSQAQDEPPIKEYIGHILKNHKRVTFEQLMSAVIQLEELENKVLQGLLSIKTNPAVFFLR